jgi:hypothetical protein
MKKKSLRKVKSLQLNRETVIRLDAEDLKKAEGGLGTKCTFEPSGCIEV